ncbi:unnamed protein product [Cyclocybe aegerita]|uniref:Extracellular mutant protein 11 C-terminal domain-containing protein n=1 Tax=Cyclocybe aegerita TaxID=1973307 RepID=A0A8S0WPH7_CYCAE|nr:unnamed protein product [Cyclocybe aegerita]
MRPLPARDSKLLISSFTIDVDSDSEAYFSMSARQPFFPRREDYPRAQSRAAFVPDPNNPLHNSGASGNAGQAQDSELLKNLDAAFAAPGSRPGNGTNASGRMPTSGLGGLKKRKMSGQENGVQNPSAGTTPMHNNNVRPGTADPRSVHAMGQQGAHIPLAVPIPHNAARSSPLLFRDKTSFFSSSSLKNGAPSLSSGASDKSAENSAHIPTLDTSSPFTASSGQHPPSTVSDPHQSPNFPSFSNQAGPQRIIVDPEVRRRSYAQRMPEGGQGVPEGHEITEDGRLKMSLHQGVKRGREDEQEDEDAYVYAAQAKRFKGVNMEAEENISRRLSPVTDRPSSGQSQSSSYRRTTFFAPEGEGASLPHHDHRAQHRGSVYNSPAGSKRPPFFPDRREYAEPGALDKLLGRDTDAFVKEKMDSYDARVKKWNECTLAQWVAGSDEIGAMFHKILDLVKKEMDGKLKLYATLNTNVANHNTILEERKQVLGAAQMKLVKESGNALG